MGAIDHVRTHYATSEQPIAPLLRVRRARQGVHKKNDCNEKCGQGVKAGDE